MAEPEEWAIDSNEALELALLGPLGSNPLVFHPDYTYPIFGDQETIYGYKGLAINIAFAGWDMRGFVKITWQQKIDPNLGVEAEDVLETLKEHLPKDVLYDENDFQLHLANPSFNPPGEKIDSYTVNSNTYTVYKSSLRDQNTIALVDRLQIFILLFIEGGSFIDTSDDRWQIFTLYEKKPSDQVPTIAGYATAYSYHYHYKGSPPANENNFYDTIFNSTSNTVPTTCRLRLSQFLILPPFQRAGHGGTFYDIIFKHARANPDVQEICVEDPSDAFEDLRDRRDLQSLESNNVFKDIKAPVSNIWIEETRLKYKMPPRQFRRCMEMSLLRDIDPHEENEEYKQWRLQVKQRLYIHNIDTLAQLPKSERIDKLQQTFKGVEDDYLRLLRVGSSGVNGDNMETDDDEDDEGDDDGDGEEQGDERPAKRVRVG